MILVNITITLFFGILFQLLVLCIVLTTIKFVIPFIYLIEHRMNFESTVFIRLWLMILRKLVFAKDFRIILMSIRIDRSRVKINKISIN